jgi:NosR/NirI family nitrous oxide reductase transcriptional regulator
VGCAVLIAAALLASAIGAQAQTGNGSKALQRHIFPDATRFGAYTGNPPAAPAYREGPLAGYVFHSQQVIASTGFSGKSLDVLVGLDLKGRITGAEIVSHQEPILVIGLSDADLKAFVQQYSGRDIREPVRVERSATPGKNIVDAVSGATISSVVINDAILRTARVVARSRGILGERGLAAAFDRYAPATWEALIADGSLARLRVTVGEVEARLKQHGARYFSEESGTRDPDAPFLELYLGLATPARVGRNLLGDREFNRVMSQLEPGDQVVFLGGRGLYSFKGTSYVRSGAFDRIQIDQGDATFELTKSAYRRVENLSIEGAPNLRETALFVLRARDGFRPADPWRADVLVGGKTPEGRRANIVLSRSYTLPSAYRPSAKAPTVEDPLWLPVWLSRSTDVVILVIALLLLSGALFFQDWLARRQKLYHAVRTGALVFTLLWIGWYTGAQLSVLNVLTFGEAVRTEFSWDFFLLDPLIFILWSYVAVTLLFWGRGVFCGWLCPFGALQELLTSIAKRLRIPQLSLPFAVHERLWPLKYVIFLMLFALSLGGLALLHEATEVEPFKTAIVLRFARAWPFLIYPIALLVGALFMERFFCRYLCPLGGALAFPARMRMFEWLKRRWQCGLQCQICANQCPVQAIHPNGRINPNECIHCLNCQVTYYDDETCPPLVERRKRRPPKITERLIKRFAEAEDAAEGAPEQEEPRQ